MLFRSKKEDRVNAIKDFIFSIFAAVAMYLLFIGGVYTVVVVMTYLHEIMYFFRQAFPILYR